MEAATLPWSLVGLCCTAEHLLRLWGLEGRTNLSTVFFNTQGLHTRSKSELCSESGCSAVACMRACV